jgi:hypothetical protein
MFTPAEERVKANLEVIRDYLKRKFPNCAIDESSSLSIWHTFIVTNIELRKHYKLQVSGSRLSNNSNTPSKTQAELDSYDVAGKMIAANGDFFSWG